MDDFENLLFEASPDGTRAAIVEQDDRVAYCYLHRSKGTSSPPSSASSDNLQACWLRNLVKGPISFSMREMEQGVPPVLPRLHCDHPDGLPPLRGDQLEVVWLEAGNGAAFLVDGQIAAIIPPWSGIEGFHGYAKHCKSPNQVCWPLPNEKPMLDQYGEARTYWQLWNEGDPWSKLQQELLDSYERVLGEHRSYFSIDGNRWPPKAVLQFQTSQSTFWLTAGVSVRQQPMPHPELPVPKGLERIEIGFRLDGELPGTYYQSLLRLISSISNYPWYAGQWIGPAHSYPFAASQEFPDDAESLIERFPKLVFSCDPNFGFESPDIHFVGRPLRWLWMVPITHAETRFMNDNGVQSLIDRLRSSGITGWHPDRDSVI